MKSKFVKILLFILLVLSLSFLFLKQIDNIKADSGWDSSYDSGSSWDSGSDWDYSSSWDNDYDYDYDYDYDSSQKGTNGSLDSSGYAILVFIIIISFIFVIFLNFISKQINKIFGSVAKTVSRSKSYAIFNPLTQNQVNKVIPNFNIEEFNFKAYQEFYDIQIAWMNFDYNKLKELVTDELYNSYVMQLETLKIKNQKNTMKEFELISSHIVDLKEENGIYIAKVYLNVRFYDYVEDIYTNNVVRGTDQRKLDNTYLLTLIKTKKEVNDINICPNCGAPVNGNITGICEYCKSKLINETHDWVISKKEKISQK